MLQSELQQPTLSLEVAKTPLQFQMKVSLSQLRVEEILLLLAVATCLPQWEVEAPALAAAAIVLPVQEQERLLQWQRQQQPEVRSATASALQGKYCRPPRFQGCHCRCRFHYLSVMVPDSAAHRLQWMQVPSHSRRRHRQALPQHSPIAYLLLHQ